MGSGKSKEPLHDSKELYSSPLPFSLGVVQTLLAACDVSPWGARRRLQTESPSGEGLVCFVALVYLSNDTDTPSRDVKKKKKEVAAIRPLLIRGW